MEGGEGVEEWGQLVEKVRDEVSDCLMTQRQDVPRDMYLHTNFSGLLYSTWI